jgi:MarR family transcriptional regulator for hemolysin
MAIPHEEPVGLAVTRVAKTLSRAFDDALATAGGSLPTWLVLVALKGEAHSAQRQLADAVGIEGATLTHHLNRMETTGLVRRHRDPANRRAQQVELTADGEAAFGRFLGAVMAFDAQLRSGLTDAELRTLRRLLDRLAANANSNTKEVQR